MIEDERKVNYVSEFVRKGLDYILVESTSIQEEIVRDRDEGIFSLQMMEADQYVEESVRIEEEDRNLVVSIFVIDDLIQEVSVVVDGRVLDLSKKM